MIKLRKFLFRIVHACRLIVIAANILSINLIIENVVNIMQIRSLPNRKSTNKNQIFIVISEVFKSLVSVASFSHNDVAFLSFSVSTFFYNINSCFKISCVSISQYGFWVFNSPLKKSQYFDVFIKLRCQRSSFLKFVMNITNIS